MGGSRHRRKRTKRRGSRKLRGGGCNDSLESHVGGKKRSRRRRSKRHSKRCSKRHSKKGGNPGLVPLGLLGSLLALGPKKHRSKRNRRRGSKRRRR